MTALDRRTFLRGLVYGLLGAVLGWPEGEAVAQEEGPAINCPVRLRDYECDGHDCRDCPYDAIAATEAAPAEEERVELSLIVPGPCWDCGVSDTADPAICARCEEFGEWLPIAKGDGLDAVRYAGHMRPWEGTAELPKQFQDAHDRFNEERRRAAEVTYVARTGPHTVEGWVEYFNSVQKGDKE